MIGESRQKQYSSSLRATYRATRASTLRRSHLFRSSWVCGSGLQRKDGCSQQQPSLSPPSSGRISSQPVPRKRHRPESEQFINSQQKISDRTKPRSGPAATTQKNCVAAYLPSDRGATPNLWRRLLYSAANPTKAGFC